MNRQIATHACHLSQVFPNSDGLTLLVNISYASIWWLVQWKIILSFSLILSRVLILVILRERLIFCIYRITFSDIVTDHPPALSATIHPVVAKVRKIVGKFRKSPVKNDILQKVVKLKHGKELRLQRDCKTRWSSLCTMLERYDRISDAVNDVLGELELSHLKLFPREAELVKDIIKTLAPFKTATEFLCRRDSNLCQAEVIIQFIDSKLKEIDSPLARTLLDRLRTRYVKRKNLNFVSLVKFYSDPGILDVDVEQEYSMITKATITRNSKSLHQRLFKKKDTNSEGDGSATTGCQDSPETHTSSSADSNVPQIPVPLAKELSDLLRGSDLSTPTASRTDTLAREIGLFTTNRQETDTIKEIRHALFVVPPTSVESERVFSASGLFLTKLRCNLNDSSLDMLIFLKFYFSRNDRGQA